MKFSDLVIQGNYTLGRAIKMDSALNPNVLDNNIVL